jgi:serine/threonine protein kinase
VHKAALDVASAMRYLHSRFIKTSQPPSGSDGDEVAESRSTPIIHRDLKSANLMLAAPPPPVGQEDSVPITVKVTDFGLSRDKEWRPDTQAGTAMMTGCGTAMWMAPEILNGEQYNESVDVFSFAMCLIELIACEMPWQGVGGVGGASRSMLRVVKVRACVSVCVCVCVVAALSSNFMTRTESND